MPVTVIRPGRLPVCHPGTAALSAAARVEASFPARCLHLHPLRIWSCVRSRGGHDPYTPSHACFQCGGQPTAAPCDENSGLEQPSSIACWRQGWPGPALWGNAAEPGCPVPERRLAGHHRLRDTASVNDTTWRKAGFPHARTGFTAHNPPLLGVTDRQLNRTSQGRHRPSGNRFALMVRLLVLIES